MKKGDTIIFSNPPSFVSFAAVGGNMEAGGPIGHLFDEIFDDETLGKDSWETAESAFLQRAATAAMAKTPIKPDLLFAGDLQSQCTASAMCARDISLPYIGLYGACSNITEGAALCACFVDGGYSDAALCLTSSHFCSAQRQFRTPLNYGTKRVPTAQWTATAAGAAIISRTGQTPFINSVTFGRVVDLAVKDAANMGAAMAPAAADTLIRYLKSTGAKPQDFSEIYTGDLGIHGSDLFIKLLSAEGITINNHLDCGTILFDEKKQDVQSGASGCGCAASVLCAMVLPGMKQTKKRVLFMATGALLSATTAGQNKTIPSISHLIEISS